MSCILPEALHPPSHKGPGREKQPLTKGLSLEVPPNPLEGDYRGLPQTWAMGRSVLKLLRKNMVKQFMGTAQMGKRG